MVDAIRQTLAHELSINPRMVVFGEDVGRKGGVHGATRDLQRKFGPERVFDTSLSEEGIIGRAVGMALGGLLPVPEIQFRKYADPAMEQLTDCGTIRWRSQQQLRRADGRAASRWASASAAATPGTASRARRSSRTRSAGGSRSRRTPPTRPGCCARPCAATTRSSFSNIARCWIRPMAAAPTPAMTICCRSARRRSGRPARFLTVVTWGAMVQRCVEAAAPFGGDVEILDLRTLIPWDRAAVLEFGAENRPLPGRTRRHLDGRLWRRDRRDRRAGSVCLARRAGHAAGHARLPSALQRGADVQRDPDGRADPREDRGAAALLRRPKTETDEQMIRSLGLMSSLFSVHLIFVLR